VKLEGRGIIVTGASQGLGAALAEACVREGAHIVVCARDAVLLEQTRKKLASLATAGQQVIAQTADVRRPEDVHRLFEMAAVALPRIDGLVNNAGVYGPKGALEDVDLQEWWNCIEINLLGVVLTCREILPIFRKQGHGKIVNLSGGGATAPLPRISAYAASKAAVVRLTETLAEETKGSGIDINAVAPGALNTRLLDEILESAPEQVGADFYERAVKQKAQGGTPLEKGVGLCLFLLSTASDGITGRLISAVWDPWENMGERLNELRSTDIYTLRRIVPADRNLKWD
jgi:3-oxoacyl-[acyl-carrier protein] reductase